MEFVFSKMSEAAKMQDFKSYLKHHSKFHEIFIYASRNETLNGGPKNLRQQAIWFRLSYLYVLESFEYAIRVHREILDLFGKKDGDQLETLVRMHILIAHDSFVQLLASKGD